jgi:branched-chain amino acid transport system permease protein
MMFKTLQQNSRTLLQYGILGSFVALYLAAIGVVETFAQRNLVGTSLSLGHVFLFIGAVGAGILTTRALKKENESNLGSAVGAVIAGMISSLFLIILTVIIQVFVVQAGEGPAIFKLRDMFLNFSPFLLDFLTFGQGLVLGNIILILFSALMGLVGASFILLPEKWRRGWINSLIWVLGLGLFSENVAQIVTQILGAGFNRFLFSNKALNPGVAIVIFILTFAFGYFGVNSATRARWSHMPETRQKKGRVVLLVLGVILLLALPWLVGLFLSQAMFMIGLFVMMGLGLNIVVGYAGLLDLGYVAFFAFGAYTMGILTSTGPLGRSDLNFWLAIPFAVLAGVLWGLLLGFPVLRMRGDYLAIVTLGFGEIIRILALSNWLAPLNGGAQGVLHIPQPEIFGFLFDTPQMMYYLVILGAALAAFVTIRLRNSRLGRQWMAMREDEDVAEAMGINLVQTKLLAFAIGAAFSALSGAIFAARLGNIFPHSFNILISINALALIIVGGIGSIPGVVVGAIILVGLPEMLREFAEYRLLFYGILLIVMMLVKPEGFVPEARIRQELQAGKEKTAGSEG